LTPICIKRAYIAPTEDSQLYSGGGLLIKAEEGKEGAVRKGRAEEKGGVYVSTFVHSTHDEPPQILDRWSALTRGRYVCLCNWHSASSLGWPFPIKRAYQIQIVYQWFVQFG